MAAQTGRTISHWVYVIVGDASNNLREIGVDSIGDVGLTYETGDVTAWADAVKNVITGQPSAPIKISGPFDNAGTATAPASTEAHALSGAHGVLSGICGDGLPHTLDIRFGIRHVWTANEPQFGLQRASATGVGYTCTKYTVNGDKYSAEFEVMGGTVPAWGTAALTAGS